MLMCRMKKGKKKQSVRKQKSRKNGSNPCVILNSGIFTHSRAKSIMEEFIRFFSLNVDKAITIFTFTLWQCQFETHYRRRRKKKSSKNGNIMTYSVEKSALRGANRISGHNYAWRFMFIVICTVKRLAGFCHSIRNTNICKVCVFV